MPTKSAPKTKVAKRRRKDVSNNSLAGILKKVEAEKLSVTEGGKRRLMSNLEVRLKKLFNQAINGSFSAMTTIHKLLLKHDVMDDGKRKKSRSQEVQWVVQSNDDPKKLTPLPNIPQQKASDIGQRSPVTGRFQSGHSGNPWGRDKEPIDQDVVAKMLRRVAYDIISLPTHAETINMNRMEAVMRRLAAMANEGHSGAILLLEKIRDVAPEPEDVPPIKFVITEADAKL